MDTTTEKPTLSAMERALEKLKEQDRFIKQVEEKPQVYATVMSRGLTERTRQPYADVLVGGGIVRLPLADSDVQPGDTVAIVMGQGIVGKVERPRATGRSVHVKRVHDEDDDAELIEVEVGGSSVFVLRGSDLKYTTLKAGDRVLMDPSGTLALRLLPPEKVEAQVEPQRVAWEDVSGHAAAKAAIERSVVWPVKYGRLLASYGQRESKGILLWGPPGCGKTLLAKATATLIADARGASTSGFFSVRGPELMNKYVGETERAIRNLFKEAREYGAQTGSRAVVFIDEADSCLGHRGQALHTDISVPAFLVEMDGIDARHAPLVILATNRPTDLDEAIVREGRVDTRIEIQRPNAEEMTALFALYLSKRPVAGIVSEVAAGCTAVVEGSPLWAQRSGAMVAALVDKATAAAMERDIHRNAVTPSGISLDDCTTAILFAEMQRATF